MDLVAGFGSIRPDFPDRTSRSIGQTAEATIRGSVETPLFTSTFLYAKAISQAQLKTLRDKIAGLLHYDE